ncbi:hypothetical protein EalM132_00140 [Exiguobacterium phage vB_EalM-132]|nr:hypothetical protein EalM132_00140 [Exiguobacterium phage vB_EalM-132]
MMTHEEVNGMQQWVYGRIEEILSKSKIVREDSIADKANELVTATAIAYAKEVKKDKEPTQELLNFLEERISIARVLTLIVRHRNMAQ